MSQSLTRRRFLQTVAAASTVYSLMPPSVLGANEKVNLACVGIAGRGKGLVKSMHGTGVANIVALCDVDMLGGRTEENREEFSGAVQFQDFRKMFDKMGDQIDALSIAVPDHSHFPIAMQAMALGKHIYVEKPLAHTFEEIDLMMAAEKKYGVAAQMGNQGHSGNNYFQFKDWTEAGIIKNVTRVTATMNKKRRWHGWEVDGYPTGETAPETMDWDTWLGTAQHHDFSEMYHPGDWRSWYDFGNGAFGDWGPHTLDTVHRFLNLGLPEEVTAVYRDRPNDFIFPQASTISFKFPERGDMPPLDITWYDGVENFSPRPDELDEGRKMDACGKIIYSDDFVFKGGTHGDTLRIIPEAKMKEAAPNLPKIEGKHSNHSSNFILACKGEEKTRSSFDVSGPLTQVFLLGVIAQRLGGTLKFDRETKQITNNKIANQLLVGPPPRKDWEQYYKL
jgi:predicted dehydrogenase